MSAPHPIAPAAAERRERMERGRRRWAMLRDFRTKGMRVLKGGSAVAVWIALFQMADDQGRVQVSQNDLAMDIGLTPRTMSTALKTLTSRGLIARMRRGTINRGPSWYLIRGAPAVQEPSDG